MKHISAKMSAAVVAGATLSSTPAHANDFSTIAENIITSIQDLPGLLTGVSYMFGILLGVLGILKVKDHVENPTQTPLKDGAIRLAAGGALFALPIVFEAMFQTIGEGDTVEAAELSGVDFNVS
jgi:hypothetical protein